MYVALVTVESDDVYVASTLMYAVTGFKPLIYYLPCMSNTCKKSTSLSWDSYLES